MLFYYGFVAYVILRRKIDVRVVFGLCFWSYMEEGTLGISILIVKS